MADDDVIEINEYEVVDKKEIKEEDPKSNTSTFEDSDFRNSNTYGNTYSRTYYSSSSGLSALLIIPLIILIIIIVVIMVFM